MVWFVFKIHLLLDANAKFSGQVHLLADKDFIAINIKIEEDQIEYIIILERDNKNVVWKTNGMTQMDIWVTISIFQLI